MCRASGGLQAPVGSLKLTFLLRRAASSGDVGHMARSIRAPRQLALLCIGLVSLLLVARQNLRLQGQLVDEVKHVGSPLGLDSSPEPGSVRRTALAATRTAPALAGGATAAQPGAERGAVVALGPETAAALSAGEAACTPPWANLATGPMEGCIELTNVCFDQQSAILYDDKYSPASPDPEPLPAFSVAHMKDNWVPHEQTIGDVYELGSGLPYPELPIRPHSRAEATADLKDPVFNRCRVPLIAYYQFAYNYFETFVNVVSRLHMLRGDGNLTGQPDLVVATQFGQELAGYHSALPAPFLARPVTSFADFSSRTRATRLPSAGGPEAQEGPPGRCFARAYLCKWEHAAYWDTWNAGQHLYRYYAQAPGPTGEEREQEAEEAWRAGPVLRVALEDRPTDVRRVLNLESLLAACNRESSWRIDAGSPFKRVECSVLRFSSNMTHNAIAVREAHALVGIHGSGLTNSMMMRYGGALVELLPRNFTTCCGPIGRFFGAMAHWNLDRVRYWSVSVEDDAAFAPGAYERKRLAAGKQTIPFDYRDRHVILRWPALKQVLESVASVGLDAERYNRERDAGWTHVAVTATSVLPLEKHDPGAAGQLPKNWMPAAAAA